MAQVKKPSAAEFNEILNRGVAHIFPSREALHQALLSGKQLTFYLGVDPTTPSLHIGNTIPLLFLRRLQQLGHRVIFLLGDFTARIGDPSGKTTARKPLAEEDIKKNLSGYKKQVARLISFTGLEAAQVQLNSSWLEKLSLKDTLLLGSHVTVQQLLGRDLFQERIEKKQPIFLHEFLYPLLQGYDSFVLDIDGEVGGNDQLFNMLVGRDLLRALKKKEKIVVAMKLLADPATGVKMSKSEGESIWLSDPSDQMYGKVMNLPDSLVFPCFELCTLLPLPEIEEMKKRFTPGTLMRKAKAKLAHTLVSLYCGESHADRAQRAFERIFREKQVPEDLPTVFLKTKKPLLDILVEEGFIPSRSEAARLIRQGGVKLDGVKVISAKVIVEGTSQVLQIGKKRFYRLKQK